MGHMINARSTMPIENRARLFIFLMERQKIMLYNPHAQLGIGILKLGEPVKTHPIFISEVRETRISLKFYEL